MKYVLFVLELIAVIITLLPFIKAERWWIRIWDFPKVQILILIVLLIICHLLLLRSNLIHIILLDVVIICFLIQLSYILPYTAIGSKQVFNLKKASGGCEISFLISNIYQENREYSKIIQLIEEYDPHLVLLMETDEKWMNALKSVEKEYPFNVLSPLDNTYGLLLYSRFPLTQTSIDYLTERNIPSIHTEFTLPSKEKISLHCVHPKPPFPTESPSSLQRDLELLILAEKLEYCTHPTIIAGDLNDVAWSHTTNLFLRKSRLLDIRRGRGMFNTFHAKYFFLRFPLDHVFVSHHFMLKSLKRLPYIGSDHFPILVKLQIGSSNLQTHKVEKTQFQDELVIRRKFQKVDGELPKSEIK